jgi:hypothetical protein
MRSVKEIAGDPRVREGRNVNRVPRLEVGTAARFMIQGDLTTGRQLQAGCSHLGPAVERLQSALSRSSRLTTEGSPAAGPVGRRRRLTSRCLPVTGHRAAFASMS